MVAAKPQNTIGVPTPGLTGTPIPLRYKHRVPAQIKQQKSTSGNNARKSSQHKGDRWKTIRAAARRGVGAMPSHLK